MSYYPPIDEDLHCPRCGYNQRTNRTRVCPECGTGFDPEAIRQEMQRESISPGQLLLLAIFLPLVIALTAAPLWLGAAVFMGLVAGLALGTAVGVVLLLIINYVVARKLSELYARGQFLRGQQLSIHPALLTGLLFGVTLVTLLVSAGLLLALFALA